MSKSFAALRRDHDRTARAIASELEKRATKALHAEAKKHPNKEVTFCSAMGTWPFYLDGEPYHVKSIDRLFGRFLSDYGWNVIPAPIKLTIKNGQFTRRTDW